MPGASIAVKSNEQEVQGVLRQMLSRFGHLTPLMKIFGAIVKTSVQRNFELGGRPRWQKLSAVTLKKRRGKGGGPLVVRGMGGGLVGSISYRAFEDRVVIGTNKQSGWLNWGAKQGAFGKATFTVPAHERQVKTDRFRRSGATFFSQVNRKVLVKAHQRTAEIPWGDVPARPYLMVQDEDWGEMKATAADWLLRGGAH